MPNRREKSQNKDVLPDWRDWWREQQQQQQLQQQGCYATGCYAAGVNRRERQQGQTTSANNMS